MSGRPLDITERQVRTIIRAAKREGATAEVKIGRAVVRLVPIDPNKTQEPVDAKEDWHL